MRHSILRWQTYTLGLLVCSGTLCAHGQEPGTSSAPASVLPGPAAPNLGSGLNPLMNPAVNPYLNPYLSNTPIPTDVAVMSMLQAQKASGGIGSGALSGVRELEQGRKAHAPKSQTSPTADVPNASERAGRYFHRGQGRFNARAGSYFQRTGGRFEH